MSDTAIFIVGLLTSLVLGGGLAFTIVEVRRIEKELEEKRGVAGGLRVLRVLRKL